MCVGIPMQVKSIIDDNIVAEIGGVERAASIMALGEEVKVGDYVVIHAGFAISKLDEEEAEATLKMMRDVLSDERTF